MSEVPPVRSWSALTSDNPAPRYNGPFHAKMLLFIRWLLPHRLIAWITRLRP